MSQDRVSRRTFLVHTPAAALALPALAAAASPPVAAGSDSSLAPLAERLLATWGEAMLRLQVQSPRDPAFYGGLLCPACARIHGRVGDAVYPFLRLARATGDARYVDAARRVFDWMENVSRDDGSWVNDPFNDWKGITVFGAIALGEALHRHGDLLSSADRGRFRDRLARAVRFLEGFITATVGNVNYRASAPLAFALAAEVLGEARYRERAREIAGFVRPYFAESGLLFGEGHPNDRVSARGCRAVDLGYNVEESLPNLAAYAALVGDRELLDLVAASLRVHLEFLLPDGGWDNSWGTRNHKWTYWGSRTSDGAPAALILAAQGQPVFLEAALRNLQLLERCTHDGLLHGGPHLHRTGQRPCLHHTFAHAKMLAAVLDRGVPVYAGGARLPRERAEGVRHFPDSETWLVARGPWRATVAASDWQYVVEGNVSGGALSLLWHERVGLVLAASMTQYQMVEAHNQALHAGRTMTLTPAIEAIADGVAYRSLNDLTATVATRDVEDGVEMTSSGTLVDRTRAAAQTPIAFRLAYRFTSDAVQIRARVDGGAAQLAVPIVSASDEAVIVGPDGAIEIRKVGGTLRVVSSQPLRDFTTDRVFNHVPGVQALGLLIDLEPGDEARVDLRVG
jgi:hypothetical protein